MLALRAAVVRVVRLVVHDQLIVHKVEAVGLRLVWVQDHLPDCEWAQSTQTGNLDAIKVPIDMSKPSRVILALPSGRKDNYLLLFLTNLLIPSPIDHFYCCLSMYNN